MKWVCLMANMTLPGVGTLICKRWVTGAIQTVGSIIGFALLGYCIYEFYHALQNYSASMDGEVDDISAALKHLSSGMMEPLVTGAVGVIILKVMWIWAQVTTAQVFKAEKAAEAQETAAEGFKTEKDSDASPIIDKEKNRAMRTLFFKNYFIWKSFWIVIALATKNELIIAGTLISPPIAGAIVCYFISKREFKRLDASLPLSKPTKILSALGIALLVLWGVALLTSIFFHLINR